MWNGVVIYQKKPVFILHSKTVLESVSSFPHDVVNLGCTDGDATAVTLTYTMTAGDTAILQVFITIYVHYSCWRSFFVYLFIWITNSNDPLQLWMKNCISTFRIFYYSQLNLFRASLLNYC